MAQQKRKKKKKQSGLSAEIFRIVAKSLQAAVDEAMDDIFRDWNKMNGKQF